MVTVESDKISNGLASFMIESATCLRSLVPTCRTMVIRRELQIRFYDNPSWLLRKRQSGTTLPLLDGEGFL